MHMAPLPPAALSPTERRALRWEIVLLLAVTFGTSALRAILLLVEALARGPLNEQVTTLNSAQSSVPVLAIAFQLLSAASLAAWGGLAAFLLLRHLPAHLPLHPLWRDVPPGVLLAAVVGLPGLAWYALALSQGWSLAVDAAGGGVQWWRLPLLVLSAWANGVGEELVVVAWLVLRLRQLQVPWGWVFAASAVLRGSYHLYQGFSAGLGNIAMGVLFVWFFRRTGRVWPLIVAHGLIDTVAFLGAAAGLAP